MKRVLGFLLTGFLGLVGSAQAAILEVSYEGTVNYTYQSGAGYSVGDSIRGSLFIDTDLASADWYSSSNLGYYYISNNTNGGFVTGHTSAGTRSHDQVLIEDDFYSSGRDRFYIVDHERSIYRDGPGNYSDTYSHLKIDAWDNSLDFINGDGIEQEFDLSANDVIDSFFAQIIHYDYAYENYRTTVNSYGYANVNLSRLTVGSASVPEPAGILLLSAGLAGLGFTRKLKRN